MPSDTLYDAAADLRALGGGRVWSLVVSLFGDLAQGEGDKIDGPVLSAIMAALEVRPEAARVALHRLRNDGWIASEKSGRISQHSLTALGRAESAAASPRIYARPNEGPENWQLVILPKTDPKRQQILNDAGMIQLMPRVFVGPADAPLPRDTFALAASTAPDWVSKQVAPAALEDDYARLRTALEALSDALTDLPSLDPLDTAVLRCLVVHNWRRLVLKYAQPPRALIDPQSDYYKCHVLVSNLLTAYPRPALSDIALNKAI
ncbi:PaaX family transcriptional regulator [Sulfitobacter aestuariivivens]|uniref:PaaX family transcriptional regulator n=1 Tax=Sulfitobacter aestuariivivens TaxID=2766981 RepID=A0A927HFU7_9RHOB|nr:PaaX family transcriptional regulator [Sulfitobacter aestuariivivens]MBD3665306.1 PaaX family transcriptional regulator [Sulfitobacter aestuariivivens]